MMIYLMMTTIHGRLFREGAWLSLLSIAGVFERYGYPQERLERWSRPQKFRAYDIFSFEKFNRPVSDLYIYGFLLLSKKFWYLFIIILETIETI